jgi:iron complex transport system ATP-binding protein
MIRIKNLSYSYGQNQVLKEVSSTIEAGILCGLFGPNGSGKTTLFRCCLGLLSTPPDTIWLDGKDISTFRVRDLARRAAYVPQEHRVPFPFKVKEVVMMGRTPRLSAGEIFRISEEHKRATVEALEILEIVDLADSLYDHLSGGQRQLVLIARAIAQQTSILFLDEPTSALDFDNQIKIWRALRSLAKQGVTILACSHDPNHVAWFCDRVIMLGKGQVVADGHPRISVTETTLKKVYREKCRVKRIDGFPVVVPEQIDSATISSPFEIEAGAR